MVKKMINTNKEKNQIHQDYIWRNAIQKEHLCARQWETEWGFYKEANNMTEINDSAKTSSKNSSFLPPIHTKSVDNNSFFPSKLPLGLSKDPDSTISAYLMSYKVNSLKQYHYPCEKYTVPPTTQSELGWTWAPASKRIPFNQAFARPEQKLGYYTLEKFQFAQGRQNVQKWWGGGPESIHILKHKVPKREKPF